LGLAARPERARVRIELSPDFKRIYATGTYGMHSPFDFRLGFYREDMEVSEGALTGREPPTLKREVLIEIVLSPVAAKLLAEQLAKSVSDYEAKYGKIPLPPSRGRRPSEGMFV